MKTRLLFAALAAASCLSADLAAQGLEIAVPPGREVHEQKLLSQNLTDVWKLDVAADEMLWCVVETSEFDPVLELFDADGNRLGDNDGAGTRSELWLRMQHAGPVQFRVHGFQGSGGGTYRFWLQRYRTEALPPHGEASHEFGAEQWFHYRVPLHAGDVLVPTASGDARITAVFDAARQPLPELLGGYAAENDGDVFVRIEGGERHRGQLTTQLARRRDLPAPRVVDDVVPPFGLDQWRLRLRRGEVCAIAVTMPEVQLDHDLRERVPGCDPAFVHCAQIDKGGCRRSWIQARRDCELLCRLRNRDGRPASYRATFAEPTAMLPLDAATPGQLALGDGNLHQLALDGGQLIRVQLGSKAFDARFDLFDPDGNCLARAVDDRSPLDRDAEFTFLVPRSGTYRVLAIGAGSGDYQLRASVLPVPQLALGDRVAVHLDGTGPQHVHLRLTVGQEVWLSVRSSAFDAGLTVIDPVGNAEFVREGGGSGGDVLAAYVASHPGVHTLLVHNRNGTGDGEVRAIAP